MEAIIVAVIFSVPGLITSYIRKRLYPNSLPEKSEYERTTAAIITSSFIVLINGFILRVIFKQNILSFSQLVDKLMYISFFTKYIILSIGVGIPLVMFRVKLLDKILNKGINMLRKTEGKPAESLFPTLWDEIFENENEVLANTIIVVEKDGQVITQGQLRTYSPPNSESKEFILTDVDSIGRYIELDQELPYTEKILGKVDKVYVNLDTGICIKFLSNEKLLNL